MSDDATNVTQDVQPGSVVEAPAGIVDQNRGAPTISEVFKEIDEDTRAIERPQIVYGLSGRKLRCVNPVPTGMMIQGLRHALRNGQDDITLTDSIDILEKWTVPEDHEAFNEAIDWVQDYDDISRAIHWILGQAAARPTGASSS
jgi:hypothetical protein